MSYSKVGPAPTGAPAPPVPRSGSRGRKSGVLDSDEVGVVGGHVIVILGGSRGRW